MIGKIPTLIAILASSIGFAQDATDVLDDGIIDQIVANKNTCAVGCSENKIYLNPSRIFPTEQGLYLDLNDADYVLLPTLNSDSNGCYVPCIDVFNKCPGCGRRYFVSCDWPDCPLVKQKQEREREKERKKEEQREMKKEKKKKQK